MIPVTQTRFGKPHGNCFAAAIASVLEAELEEFDFPWPEGMPIETEEDWGHAWEWRFKKVDEVLLRRGLYLLCVQVSPACKDWKPSGYHLIGGLNSAGVPHAVVGKDGEPVHDPNPSRSGLAKIEDYWVFVAPNPALMKEGK